MTLVRAMNALPGGKTPAADLEAVYAGFIVIKPKNDLIITL